jgi:hypothetical protein
MGQSVDAYIAYGFSVDSEGTPDEFEPYFDNWREQDWPQLSKELEVVFWGWGEIYTPFICVARTKIWAMDGAPKSFDPTELFVTPDEIAELVFAQKDLAELMDQEYPVELSEFGWVLLGTFG